MFLKCCFVQDKKSGKTDQQVADVLKSIRFVQFQLWFQQTNKSARHSFYTNMYLKAYIGQYENKASTGMKSHLFLDKNRGKMHLIMKWIFTNQISPA